MEKVKVELHSATGQRTIEVKQRGGFPTRGIVAPREVVPSLFGDISIKPKPPTEPETESRRSPLQPLGDATQVRCYRINADGTQSRIYIGCMTDDLRQWCQEQADTTRCTIQMHTADSCEFFKPVGNALRELLMEVDAILDGGVDNA